MEHVRAELAARHAALQRAADEHLRPLGCTVSQAEGGYFVWVTLPGALRTRLGAEAEGTAWAAHPHAPGPRGRRRGGGERPVPWTRRGGAGGLSRRVEVREGVGALPSPRLLRVHGARRGRGGLASGADAAGGHSLTPPSSPLPSFFSLCVRCRAWHGSGRRFGRSQAGRPASRGACPCLQDTSCESSLLPSLVCGRERCG